MLYYISIELYTNYVDKSVPAADPSSNFTKLPDMINLVHNFSKLTYDLFQ